MHGIGSPLVPSVPSVPSVPFLPFLPFLPLHSAPQYNSPRR